MNAVRRAEGLLPAIGVVALIELAAQAPRPEGEIARIVAARGAGAANRAVNSLRLLHEMGLVETGPLGVALTVSGHAIGDLPTLRAALADHYRDLLQAAPFGSLFQRDPETGAVLVDRVLLPHREIGLPYLLADAGVFHRTGERAWTVANDVADRFLALIKAVNGKATRAKPMSPADLDGWLANRRAAGELAEAFALAFERRRLDGHPMVDQVRWMASEDVGAGFDIHAFDDLRSLALDRFIEVKGHGGDRSFHWSTGEIAAAREKRQRYWLYLVDRRRVDDPGYAPEMYPDPLAFFIEDNPEGWSSEPSSFMFSAPKIAGG